MDLFPTPLISSGRIMESFEIFTYLARIGDQNSFICPFIQSMFVDHLVNVRHYPPGVAIHRGKQTRESVILMPERGNTECYQGTVEGHPPLTWGALVFLLPPHLSPAPQSRCTGDCGAQVLRGPASFAVVYQSQMVLLINLVST